MQIPTPSQTELREFYLCGIRTGYDSPQQAQRAGAQWENHTTYDCEYCPGVHHVKADALASQEQLTHYAEKHWVDFLDTLNTKYKK